MKKGRKIWKYGRLGRKTRGKGDEFFYVLVNTYEITELVDATTDTMALGNKDAIEEDIFKV